MRSILSLSVALLICNFAGADDWPQWLGLKRDGATAEVVKPWKEPLKVAWKQTVGVQENNILGHGGPVVAKGKLYLFYRTPGKSEEVLAAFEADTGKPIWKTPYPRRKGDFAYGSDPRSAPCLAGDKIYTFGITSVLTCFDANGKIAWQVDGEKDYKAPALFFGSSCSPIVVGDLVLVCMGAKGASIVAFDKNTGKEVWKKLDDGASYSSPFLYERDGQQRVAFLTARGLVTLNPKDGSVHSQHSFIDLLLESSCTPMMIDGKLLISSITAGSVLLQEKDKEAKPEKIWAKSLNCYFSTPVAYGKDTIFMVTGDLIAKKAMLRCVDANSGNDLWTHKGVGNFHATLLRTGDNKMLLVEEGGELVLFDPNRKAYTELSRSKICGGTWAHPALANGRLYIRDDRDLICVELPK